MKLLIFFALILVSCNAAVYGQDEEKGPLKLTIKLDAKKVCVGDSLNVAVTLKNISKHAVVIDPKMIGNRSSLSWSTATSTGSRGGAVTAIGHQGRHIKPDFVVLEPGKSYRTDTQYTFDEKDIVASPNYSLEIGYGQTSDSVFNGLEVWRGFV
ncbi:MAG: hypothetical protein H0V76_12875 [Blastocatellia bacterium]|nr:hypothetical protein [Blastocatellia bacterium]